MSPSQWSPRLDAAAVIHAHIAVRRRHRLFPLLSCTAYFIRGNTAGHRGEQGCARKQRGPAGLCLRPCRQGRRRAADPGCASARVDRPCFRRPCPVRAPGPFSVRALPAIFNPGPRLRPQGISMAACGRLCQSETRCTVRRRCFREGPS
jgi:hypothetical protein